MNISLSLDGPRLTATLVEGKETAEVIGWGASNAAALLEAAVDDAEIHGYGECFWPEPTGHFWWMLRREDQRLEVVVLWSRSSAVGWQHVFRAADEMSYFRERVRLELARLPRPSA
jgi:hypothetical protein